MACKSLILDRLRLVLFQNILRHKNEEVICGREASLEEEVFSTVLWERERDHFSF